MYRVLCQALCINKIQAYKKYKEERENNLQKINN